MPTNDYEDIGCIPHNEAESRLSRGDVNLIARTLIAMGLHDEDGHWVQRHALHFLSHENSTVVSAAILSLAHTARVNRSIEKTLIVPALLALSSDPRYEGVVQDAIDDIDTYVRD